MGRACVAPKGLGLALVKADCFRFRLDLAIAEPRFVAYALSATAPQAAGELSGGSTRQRINLGNMASRKLLLPPLSEQVYIADFLDEQTARIDALIAEKELLRERVQEYEQAEISRLVRTGLRHHALMGTGREVLPEAPKGWRVTAFKRAISFIEQGWSPQCDSRPAEAGEWGVLKVGCVNGTVFDPNENKALPPTLKPDLSCALKKGDVLMSRANTRELVGMTAVVDSEYSNLLLCDKLYRLRLRPDWLNADYAVLLLRCDYVRRQIELGASGASASMQNISQGVVRELAVALPSLEEQLEIVEAAYKVRAACTSLKSHVADHIERLREYRSSLISAAVTGQLDLGATAPTEEEMETAA